MNDPINNGLDFTLISTLNTFTVTKFYRTATIS